MKQFFKNLFNHARTRPKSIDELMGQIKENAISITPIKYNYIIPQKTFTSITYTPQPRPFYRAARPAKRWK